MSILCNKLYTQKSPQLYFQKCLATQQAPMPHFCSGSRQSESAGSRTFKCSLYHETSSGTEVKAWVPFLLLLLILEKNQKTLVGSVMTPHSCQFYSYKLLRRLSLCHFFGWKKIDSCLLEGVNQDSCLFGFVIAAQH